MSSDIWYDLWLRLPEWSHIGIDLPGHGASPPPQTAQRLPELARMIGLVAVEQRVEHIVGLSFGAIIALQIAIELPSSFRTFTLAAASLTGGTDEPGTIDRYRELMRLHRKLGLGPWMTQTWMRRPPDIFAGARKRPRVWRNLKRIINHHSWSELETGFVQRWVSYRQVDRLEDLTSIRASLLLIVGEHEMDTFRVSAETIRNQVAGSLAVTLAGAGHLCILEVPDAASRVIARHLSCASNIGC